jgi:diguanylate cyclase (GGDEF)-like protein
MAKGDVLGLLHIRNRAGGRREDDNRMMSNLRDVSATLTEMLALSISNIKLRETLSTQSIRDPLTGLFNRRYMEESFPREISRAARKQDPIGVLMVDIDRFKTFNDLHGHPAGDAVLAELADFFRTGVRGGDIICRYGGEEFTLILPECSLEDAGKRATYLINEAKKMRISYGGQTIGPITLSAGVAAYPQHGVKPGELLRAADAALYRAKQEGRDRVVLA